MSKIACDIDDTLYNFGNQVRKQFFELAVEKDDKSLLKGAYAPHVEWRSLIDSMDTDGVVYEAILRVHDNTDKQIPFEGAVYTMTQIHDSGHDIEYVTSRLPKYHDLTTTWLYEQGFPQPNNVKCIQGDKVPHLQNHNVLIDDRPQTVVDFVTDYTWKRSFGQDNKIRRAFGLWLDYNRALTDIPNVYLAPNWTGINFYLKRKGVITLGNS